MRAVLAALRSIFRTPYFTDLQGQAITRYVRCNWLLDQHAKPEAMQRSQLPA